jgi:hypothetical protein
MYCASRAPLPQEDLVVEMKRTDPAAAIRIQRLIEKLSVMNSGTPIEELEKISEEIRKEPATDDLKLRNRLEDAYIRACTREWNTSPQWFNETIRAIEGRTLESRTGYLLI